MSLKSILAGFTHRFRRQEQGSIAIEAVIILPMVFWTFLALYATFHAYRTYVVNQKVAYTIGDMISRETNPLDAAYMAGARELMAHLINTSDANVSLRVTSVKFDGDSQTYERHWSQSEGFVSPASAQTVENWDTNLPVLPDDEYIVVVETFQNYTPPFDTGLAQREVRNFVFTKPRYAPRTLWDNGS